MVEKLTAIGMPISWERVLEIAGEASVGRPHVAQALVEAGTSATINEAFDLYIGRNGPAYVEREKMDAERGGRRRCKRFGAPPVLAHPSYIKNVEDLLPELDAGRPRGHGGLLPRLRRGHPVAARGDRASASASCPSAAATTTPSATPASASPATFPLPSRVAKDFLEKELPWVPTGALT